MKERTPTNTPAALFDPVVLESIHNYEGVRGQLLEQLLRLDRIAFERLILDLLRKSGFSNVQLADRIDKRGRTMQGGIDIKAYSENDITRSLTIAMVKQYEYPVPRRFVDELQNVMKRFGAGQGLLITTSGFGTMARRVAASDSARPVTLLDGDALLQLLISHRVGVKEETVQRLMVDDAFLSNLR